MEFLCAVLAQIDPVKIVNYFLVESCLWTVGQYYTGNFLCNVGSGRSRQHCSIGYFPVKRWLWALTFHKKIFLNNVVSDVFRQHWLDCGLSSNTAQVTALYSVGSGRFKITLRRLFSYKTMSVRSGLTLHK